MKLLLLGLVLFSNTIIPPSVPVHVAITSLTKRAYLAAKKGASSAKPSVTFPLKKQHGRLMIPTAKGMKVFTDKYVNTDRDDQAQYEYRGYLPQFGSHVVLAHLWERTQWFLIAKSGKQLELYAAPVYSPSGKSFVAISAGLEYSVYPNSLRLFRFEGQSWREVWTLEPESWEPIEICWTSESTLLLSKRTLASLNSDNSLTYSKLTVK
jgi:hypothetical protein